MVDVDSVLPLPWWHANGGGCYSGAPGHLSERAAEAVVSGGAGGSAARVPAAANKLISASAAADTIASDTYRRNMDVFMGLRYLPL